MPRTVEEILQHADELAARFESYEPDPKDELDSSPGSAWPRNYSARAQSRSGTNGWGFQWRAPLYVTLSASTQEYERTLTGS